MSDAKRFIHEHQGEIKPLIGDEEKKLKSGLDTVISDVEVSDERAGTETVDALLERYENKLFYYEKTQFNEEARRVLLTASDPGPYNAIRPVIQALKDDPRCNGIGALISGVGGQIFQKEFGSHFTQMKNKDTLLQDVSALSKEKSFDVALASPSAYNGPENVILFGGKSSLEIPKIFLIVDGWGGMSNILRSEGKKNVEKIDGIFCNDELARDMILYALPEFSKEYVFITGSPVFDTLKEKDPKGFREAAKEKMGLKNEAISVLYLGDISLDHSKGYKTDKRINEKTFEYTLNAIIKLAEAEPSREFVFLVRPHPRDSNKEELLAILNRHTSPGNLQFKSAGVKDCSMQEARYASDIVASIGSTENFFARKLGRGAIFLSYPDNLGEKVLRKIYGEEILEQIEKNDPMIKVAYSPEEVTSFLSNFEKPLDEFPALETGDSVKIILDKILS